MLVTSYEKNAYAYLMFCECATLRYSLHLSTMYGHNHAFFDPNIWHLDEELRKQVETFAKCFIMTGQEAPETSKKLHVDLYKKTISADGIMGRKPYGYSTRMFHTVGWTRLEVNRIMQFVGVKSKSFFPCSGDPWSGRPELDSFTRNFW